METFKLKISLGDAQIELEGNENMVQTIFQELRDKGLGALQPAIKTEKPAPSNNNLAAENPQSGAAPAPEDDNPPLTNEIPTLENVVLKGGPQKEAEWILLYAFYCSNQGSSFFTRDDLRSQYDKTNRLTAARSKNFATNIKSLVSSGYISAVNTNDFRIETVGLSKAKAILLGPSPSTGDKPKSKSTTGKKTPVTYKMIDLNLSESERQSFKAFWDSHNHTTPIDKAVVVAFWLKKEKGIVDFSADHFFTMLRTIEETININLVAAIANAKSRKSYFITGSKKGTFAIHHIGEDHIKSLEQKGE